MRSGLEIELNEREKAILHTIVQLFILKASPIGSRNLSKWLQGSLNLSPASIRNIMADLEEMELISHPHTSAGRIPTDKGYRLYVDNLMKIEQLSAKEKKAVKDNLISSPAPNILKDASKILGLLSHYLGIVEIPKFRSLKVEKFEIVPLSSTRILIVLALDSNNIKTVTLEATFEFDQKHLNEIASYINEKIAGKPLSFIKDNFQSIISSGDFKDLPLVRLFVDSVDTIFSESSERLIISGAQNLLQYPEFDDVDKIKSVIEIVENEDIIIHLLEKQELSDSGIRVLIGSEMAQNTLEDYSLVISTYSFGSSNSSIGLIGPKRMNYSKMVALVNYVAEIISAKK